MNPTQTPAYIRLVDLADRDLFRVAARRVGKWAKQATGAEAKRRRQLARDLRALAKDEQAEVTA